jgi:hypothetical protein
VTGSNHTTWAILLKGDFHGTHTTGTIRLELWGITKRRHMATAEMAIDDFENGVTGLEEIRLAVDEGGVGGDVLGHGGDG